MKDGQKSHKATHCVTHLTLFKTRRGEKIICHALQAWTVDLYLRLIPTLCHMIFWLENWKPHLDNMSRKAARDVVYNFHCLLLCLLFAEVSLVVRWTTPGQCTVVSNLLYNRKCRLEVFSNVFTRVKKLSQMGTKKLKFG